MHALTPCLWFDGTALAAATAYTALIPDSEITFVSRAGGPEGPVRMVGFTLFGRAYTALNGGPMFPHTPAVSLVIDCADQAEVDHYWAALTADGGAPGRCGWCTDRFGLSWQVIPRRMIALLSDPATAAAAGQAMMGMGRIDIAALEAAAGVGPAA